MNKLLSASFARLRKDKLFWFCLVAMFGFCVYIRIDQYYSVIKYGSTVTLDNLFFGYPLMAAFAMSIFSSIFLGTEYSDGTIRNKLIAGHSRNNIYFSNLITNIASAMLMCLAFILASFVVGIPLLGFLKTDMVYLLLLFLGTIMLTIALCAIFTMLSMVCSNKTTIAVVSIFVVLALMLLAMQMYTRLREPEFYTGVVIYDASGAIETMNSPNPMFLTGAKRDLYQFILDSNPMGQSIQFSDSGTVIAKPLLLPLYSLIISIVTTVIGVVVFRRKDLK